MATSSAILRTEAMSWVIVMAAAAERLYLFDDEVVDGIGGDRIEPRGGFVEEDQVWVRDNRAGEGDTFLAYAR